MNIPYLIIMGLLFGLAFIIPIHKLDNKFRRVFVKYQFMVDVTVGAMMAYLFYGTQGGMVIATIATILFSVYLSLMKRYAHLGDPQRLV